VLECFWSFSTFIDYSDIVAHILWNESKWLFMYFSLQIIHIYTTRTWSKGCGNAISPSGMKTIGLEIHVLILGKYWRMIKLLISNVFGNFSTLGAVSYLHSLLLLVQMCRCPIVKYIFCIVIREKHHQLLNLCFTLKLGFVMMI
jgi:hypothetical protein